MSNKNRNLIVAYYDSADAADAQKIVLTPFSVFGTGEFARPPTLHFSYLIGQENCKVAGAGPFFGHQGILANTRCPKTWTCPLRSRPVNGCRLPLLALPHAIQLLRGADKQLPAGGM